MPHTSDVPLEKVRQRSSTAVGWIGVFVGLALMIAGLWGSFGIGATGLLVAVFAYCVMVRPFIAFTQDGVVISNVIREVRLPWAGISHALSRGSLTVIDNQGKKTTSWAISAQMPRGGAEVGSLGAQSLRPTPDSLVAPPKSAAALRELLNAETVDNPADVPSRRSVRWLPLPCCLLVVAVIALCVAIAL